MNQHLILAVIITLITWPGHVPKKAQFHQGLKQYQLSNDRVDAFWDETGKILIFIEKSKHFSTFYLFSPAGSVKNVYQFRNYIDEDGMTNDDSFGRGIVYYPNGKKKREYCIAGYEEIEGENELLCGVERFFKKNGTLKRKKHHRRKCKFGCGIARITLPKGAYHIVRKNTKVRSAPKARASTLGVLKKGDKVIVLRTTKAKKVGKSFAPWLEVTYQGKKGYIFGGHAEPVDFAHAMARHFAEYRF